MAETSTCPMCGHEKTTPECPACGEVSPQPPSKVKSYIKELFIPTIIGCFAGAFVLGPFMRSPGDPSGISHGAACGGFLGLAAGFVLRRMRINKRDESV